jgi:hypothetical protein
MSGAGPSPGGDAPGAEAPPRCEACGATRPGPAPAAPPPPEPAPEHAAPAGTHCEWCGAEFPDEA